MTNYFVEHSKWISKTTIHTEVLNRHFTPTWYFKGKRAEALKAVSLECVVSLF